MTAREVLDGIKDRLTKASDAELELVSTEPSMSGQHFSIRRKGVPGLRINGHEYGHGGAYTDLIVNAPVDVARLTRAVEAVLAVHVARQFNPISDGVYFGQTEFDHNICDHDHERWPCPTVAAIEDALNPKEGQ